MNHTTILGLVQRTISLGAIAGVTACLAATIHGCQYGAMTETIPIEAERDFSGIALPGSGIPQHPNLHDRASWGKDISYASLGYENASAQIQALFEFADPAVTPPAAIEDQSPVQFFSTPHTDAEGVGPLFNQRACIGCHNSSTVNKANLGTSSTDSSLAGVNTVNTPVSRAGRQGFTNQTLVATGAGNPPTVAFTLYGDYYPASGAFDPLTIFGGPLQHDEAIGTCEVNALPPLDIDPNLQGGIDPVTGLSPLGARRAMGERAAPPYVARGLMEAIYFGDLLNNADPLDEVNTTSSLAPQPDPLVCPNDCISGRPNQSASSASFVGGDPLIRIGRFGLRGAGTTLLQFDVGGTQGEIGLTSPFAPFEQPNIDTLDPTCNAGGPTPNITAARVESLRDMVRNIAPPMQASTLYENPPSSDDGSLQVQQGAALFGLDLTAFVARMTQDTVDPSQFSTATNQAQAGDVQLGCATCHTPVFRTGVSPALVGGPDNLSNRWAPIFSDLLIHQNPEIPYYLDKQWEISQPMMVDPSTCVPGPCNPAKLIPAPYPFANTGNVDRSLSDYAIIPNVTGIADGNEFRTPPLMGLGRVGPPFLHDARVYLNVVADTPAGALYNYPGQPPNPTAETVFTSADGGTVVQKITTMDLAVLAAIELHDLPAPPINPGTHLPDYTLCPKVTVSGTLDVCSRQSSYRGEARNVMEKFHALTQAQQMAVVKFLETL